MDMELRSSFLVKILIQMMYILLLHGLITRQILDYLYLIDKLDINGGCACGRYTYGYQGS
jgi:hypothetical protein